MDDASTNLRDALNDAGFFTTGMPMADSEPASPRVPTRERVQVLKPKSMKFLGGQKRATATILKFCRDHNLFEFFLLRIETCLRALEDRDIDKAFLIFKELSRAGMGCFLEWEPEPVFPHETKEYTGAVFDSLFQTWSWWMKQSLEES